MNEENTNMSIEENENDIEFNTDELRSAMEKQFEKLRNQSMLIGCQAICSVILEKVTPYRQPNSSKRDLVRICKDIEKFCLTGLSREVNDDGTTSELDLTVQN